jgi:hypothetical protein
MDAFIHYGMAAGIQAIENSGLEITEENAERIGVAIGAGIGGLGTIEKTWKCNTLAYYILKYVYEICLMTNFKETYWFSYVADIFNSIAEGQKIQGPKERKIK